VSALWVHVEGLAAGGSAGILSLAPEEARHVASRRLRVGDSVVAFDGGGCTAPARIDALSKRSVEIELGEVTHQARVSSGLALASAIPKGERLSVMLPMLIQLGLETWQPLVLEESAVRKLDVASPRLRRILIEGCKLARRPWRMRVLAPTRLDDALARVEVGRDEGVSLFYGDRLGCVAGLEGGSAWVFIGPEAGFTEAERARLEAAGARARCFGAHNLRIETAAVAATAAHFVAQGSGRVAGA